MALREVGSLNILLTSVGRRVALVNSFKRALEGRGLKGKIVSVDANPLASGLYLSDDHYIVPKVSDDEYIPTLLKICGEHEIGLLIPLIDTELLPLARNKRRFEQAGIKVVVSEPKVIEVCADKYSTYQFFHRNNIPTLKVFSKEEALLSSTYPLFIKPRYGSASINTFPVRNEKELSFFLDYIPEAIIQEYSPGKEYTLDVLADFEGNVVRVVPRERIETRGGETTKGITVKDRRLIEWGKRITEALGAIGPVNIQCFVADEAVRFTEVNPRFAGGLPLSLAAGANYPLLLIKMALGEKVEGSIDEFEEGLIMLRYDDAVFVRRGEMLR